jgi:hypothetical protein
MNPPAVSASNSFVNESVCANENRWSQLIRCFCQRVREAVQTPRRPPACALCRAPLLEEDHGWYSVWRCRKRHFSEAVLHRSASGRPVSPRA